MYVHMASRIHQSLFHLAVARACLVCSWNFGSRKATKSRQATLWQFCRVQSRSLGSTSADNLPFQNSSAMKMESIVTTPVSGKVQKVAAAEGDSLSQGDLICLSTLFLFPPLACLRLTRVINSWSQFLNGLQLTLSNVKQCLDCKVKKEDGLSLIDEMKFLLQRTMVLLWHWRRKRRLPFRLIDANEDCRCPRVEIYEST